MLTDEAAQFEQLQSSLGGRYRLVRELGRGGMATVYLAEEPRHERHLALKVLHPRLATSLGPARFLREIKMTAGLSHPHILPLFDSGEVDGFLFYVMPYVAGESLRSRLRREHQLPIDDALRITREVADALGFAHTRGLVHRDVKPENILLEADHAVVADFGLGKAISEAGEEALTNTGLAVGTPQYMSPEQAGGSRDLDGRSDIYSLACVTYEMLTGDPPFAGSVRQAVLARKAIESPAPLRYVRDTLAPHVEQAVLRALARVPADRFSTMQQFTDVLFNRQPPLTAGGGAASRDRQADTPGPTLPLELRPLNDELNVFGLTHPGKVQRVNQDHFLICSIARSLAIHQTSLPHGAQLPRLGDRQAFIAMIADGMGRNEWGEAASRLAVEVMTQCLVHSIRTYRPASEAEEEEFMGGLREAVYQFRANVAQRAREAGTARGMTASLLMWIGNWPKMYLVQAGNCRCYLFRKGQLVRLTKDMAPQDPPLVFSGQQDWGNVGLICSPGLTRHLSEDQIRTRLAGTGSARKACEDLLQDALDGGGTENITIVIGQARTLPDLDGASG
jgi:serine/threonine protein kinase